MNILLTGAAGQLGTELQRTLQGLGTIHLADRVAPEGLSPGQGEFSILDLADSDAVTALLQALNPAVVINAAAYTAVDQAESEPDLARAVNADAPAAMANWCAAHDAILVHYSTDYVFAGDQQRPYRESDATAPINVYGETKLAGEQAIGSSGCRHVILRTAWIYSSHGNNFLRTMLRLAGERPELSVVNDQHGCPTWARNLARVTRQVAEHLLGNPDQPGASGVFHYCDSPATTWYDFAQLIFQAAEEQGLLDKAPQVKPVSSAQFKTAAKRPQYSVLDTGKIRQTFGVRRSDLATSVEACLEELQNNE